MCQSVCHVLFIPGGQTFLHSWGWGQKIYVGGGGGNDDVDEGMDMSEANLLVSKANILVSEVSKLSTGARIFRGPYVPEILVMQKSLQKHRKRSLP